jgi:hypothetical protein
MKLSTLHLWWRPLTSYLVFATLSNTRRYSYEACGLPCGFRIFGGREKIRKMHRGASNTQTDAVRKLQRFQEAAEPACPPAETQPRVSPARPAFVN